MGAGKDTAARGDLATLVAPAQRARLFNFDAQGIRVVGSPENPWFVARDVCAALGIANSRDSIESLDDDEKGVAITDTLGGPQELSTVNESGLYALIFRSRKPEARLFRRWVTAEVLPAIRKTGRYAAPAPSLPACPATGYSHFIRHDSFRVRDLATEDFACLCNLLLEEASATRRILPLRQIAEACVRHHRLWWLVGNADCQGDRVALGLYLRKRNGLATVNHGESGARYAVRATGHRRRRWLVISSYDPLWRRHVEQTEA